MTRAARTVAAPRPLSAGHPRSTRLITAAAAAALLALTGCGAGGGPADRAADRAPDPDSAGSASGGSARPPSPDTLCPPSLPASGDSPAADGADSPAPARPTLATPDRAWVCEYVPTDSHPSPGAPSTEGAAVAGWTRDAGPVPVPDAALTELGDALSALAPAAADRICTMDLGPRWMLVYADGRDLVGVVVDDFGCHEVRLTSDPTATPPGVPGPGDDRAGVVPGVLQGPQELLAGLEGVADAP